MSMSEIPPQFRCPICGKWGRRHSWEYDYEKRQSISILHCSPNARRGGKGCGEYFRVITPEKSACAIEVPKWAEMQPNVDSRPMHERMIDLGYEAIKRLKESGKHFPFVRNARWNSIYRVFFKSDPNSYLCGCGCGRVMPNSSQDFHKDCSKVVYGVAEMIANPGRKLTWFMCQHVNNSTACEHCKADTGSHEDLELDHIVEVNEGGGMCWLDNFQVLCRECHKKKTAAYAAKRAQRRRDETIQQSNQMQLFSNSEQ